MTTYNTVFGGNLIQPTQVAYNPLTLTAGVAMAWPIETAPNGNLLTPLVDIVSSSGSYVITLPPANQVSVGQCCIFNNKSANQQQIVANDGTVVVASIVPGAIYFCYITNNSTVGGAWSAFQYGAQVSTANAAALAGAGLIASGSLLAQSIPVISKSTNYSVGVIDRASFFNWNGGTGTFTLPLASAVGNNWYVQVRNTGSAALTIQPSGSDTINSVASLTFSVGDSAFIVSDGTSFYTIGLGAVVNNNFNPVSINLGGLSGTYTLPANQYAKVAYTFFGALAGSLQIVVPATPYQYWVDNQTTGGFVLSIGINAQPSPPTVATNARNIYYYNPYEGIVIPINTAAVALPVSVANGGTGSTTASGARSTLGSTSVGDAVFIAANTLAAQTAMAAPSFADAFLAATAL